MKCAWVLKRIKVQRLSWKRPVLYAVDPGRYDGRGGTLLSLARIRERHRIVPVDIS